MRDPVADFLAERASPHGGLATAIVVSFVLHAGGGAIAVYAGLRQPPPKAVSRVNIRLAQAPASAAIPAAAPAVASAAPPQPVAPRIQEPQPEPVKPPPQKAPEPPQKDTAPASPFGRSTKKPAEAAPPPPPPQPPASVASTSTIGGGGSGAPIGIGEAGITGIEGGDFPYTLYLENMESLIGRRWVRPPVTGQIASVVYFRIQRDGTIRDVNPIAPSGNGMFDRAALRAVLEASPLPPLPGNYSGTYLGVHLTFR